MIRVAKEHDERRQEFLDTAGHLFAVHGYGQTSVAMILDAMGVAKGTFYHYFDSKEDLLDQLVERMGNQVAEGISTVLENPDIPTLDKIKAIVQQSKDVKLANKEFIILMMTLMYDPKNLLLLQKYRQLMLKLGIPIWAKVIRQGNAEGVLTATHPEETAEMMIAMGNEINVTSYPYMMQLLKGTDSKKKEVIEILSRKFEAYSEAVERLLGAPMGTFDMPIQSFLEELAR